MDECFIDILAQSQSEALKMSKSASASPPKQYVDLDLDRADIPEFGYKEIYRSGKEIKLRIGKLRKSTIFFYPFEF